MTDETGRNVSDDDLRARLSRIDPAPAGFPVDPVTSPRARELVERAMQTLDPSDDLAVRRRRRRPVLLASAGGMAALVGGVLVLGSPFDDQVSRPVGGQPTTLTLEAPAGDVAGSCMVFSVDVLREMPVAVAGTVTSVDPGSVTLDVDRWYRGGDADLVTITVPETNSVALDGVDLRAGERYLITATNGTVNGCGYSGPADPQLESAFADAFGG